MANTDVLRRETDLAPTSRLRPVIRSALRRLPLNRPQLVETATWWLSSPRLAARTVERLLGLPVASVQKLGVNGQRRVLLAQTERGPVVLHLTLNRHYASQLAWGFAFAARNAIPAPKLLACATDPLAIPRLGAWALIVSFVEGTEFAVPSGPHKLAKLGALLARIHAIPESEVGDGGPSGGSAYDMHWLDFSDARRAEIEKLLARCGRAAGRTIAGVCDRLARAAHGVDLGMRHLVHGDAHPGNVIETTDGELCLLDLESLRFGISELELNFVLEQYCGADRAQRTSLLAGYRLGVGADTWERWEANLGFWREVGALHLLELQLGILIRARSRGEMTHVRNMQRVVEKTFRQLDGHIVANAA